MENSMIAETCFRTMDGNPVKVHRFPMKMLYPPAYGMGWPWARSCVTEISLVTADFCSPHSFDIIYLSYSPFVIIWSGLGGDSNAFTFLRNDEEKIPGVPLFSLCHLNKEIRMREDGQRQIDCGPFLLQFIDESYEQQILEYIDETTDRINKGFSISPQNAENLLPLGENFIFGNGEIGLRLNYSHSYFSPELLPIINKWKLFFTAIKNETGVLPQPNSPIISHCRSTAELYNIAISRPLNR